MNSIFSNVTASAERITRLTWFMIILAAIVYVAVIALMLVAMQRNRRAPRDTVILSDPGPRWIVIGGLIMPAVVLGAVLVFSLWAMGRERVERPALTIDVTGHQ